MVSVMEEPYYMTNKEWYYHDDEEFCDKLTDKAPPEAKKSYEEFYKLLDSRMNDDIDIIKKIV